MNNTSIFFTMVMLAAATSVAATTNGDDAGIYGRLDLAKFHKPQVTYLKPFIADSTAKPTSTKPAYFHVAPGQEQHWRTLCQTYNACATPVYFVTENWFLNVYLPAISAQDGREQRYRVEASRERSAERDNHDAHGVE